MVFRTPLSPNRLLGRFSIIFRLFPSLPIHLSFACRAYSLSYSLDVARYATKNMADNTPDNQTKSAQTLTADLG